MVGAVGVVLTVDVLAYGWLIMVKIFVEIYLASNVAVGGGDLNLVCCWDCCNLLFIII